MREDLLYELEKIFNTRSDNREMVKLWSYQIKMVVIDNLDSKSNQQLLNMLADVIKRRLSKEEYARFNECLDNMRIRNVHEDSVLVKSIDRVKGLEGSNCLFILTPDLAPYLFNEKQTDNKMKNYLYMALTRSKKINYFSDN